MNPDGYDREELYFHDLNQKLIDEQRAQLNDDRQAQAHKNNKALHWMKCPKCGEDMSEVELSGIKVDRCTACDGLFFDKGELKLLLESRDHASIWDRLRGRA